MSIELIRKLAKNYPQIASLYLECIKDDYIASMDDVRLVLSSLPKDFPTADIINLYLFAQKQKSDLDYEISQELEQITLPEPNIKDFNPLYNHNLGSLISPSSLPQEEDWMMQYSNARLFQEQISKTKKDILKKYEDKKRELQNEANAKQRELKSFITYSQNIHSSGVEQAADESFAQLKRTYPQCNIAANIKEIEKFITNLPKNSVTKKNIALARSLLRVIKNNSSFSGARERLAYVWEAIKDTEKLSDRGETVSNIAQFQQNLRESVITQLASIETNYSVEGTRFAGASRSCSGGTQNAIVQILDGYHQNVSINYSFKGSDQAPILNKDLAKDIYQEIFLEKLSKISHADREAIIRSWNPDFAMLDQVQLSEAQRLILLQISIETERTILAKYNTSQLIWFGEVKRNIEQSASLTSVALLKPEFDLLYEYKEIIRSKKFSYDETIEAIKGGGDLKFLAELMEKVKEKKLAFSEDVLRELLPKIKQEDLDSLREEILKSEYKSIDSAFSKLSAKKRIDAVLYPEKFLNPLLKKKSATLATDLTKRFIQNAQTEFDPILIKKFKKEEQRDIVAKAIFDGRITNLEKADLESLFKIYEYRTTQLNIELETLKALQNNQTNSLKKAEIARQIEYADKIIGKKYFEEALRLFNSKILLNFVDFLKNTESSYPELFKIILQETNNDQNTLIHLSLLQGYTLLAANLIAKEGVDLNIKNNYGQTPLDIAIVNKHYALAEALIAKEDVNINLQNIYGNTALHLALNLGLTKLAAVLIAKKGVDLNIRNNYGQTPLQIALAKGYHDIAATLIAKEGVNLNLQNQEGQTPLDIAIVFRHNALAEAIVAKEDVNINLQNTYGNTPLHLALNVRFTKLAAVLIEKKGVDLNIKNNKGQTPLHIALENGHNALAEAIIAKEDVNINLQNTYGNAALHLALNVGLTKLAAVLIAKKGVDLNIRNNYGQTPLQIALAKGYHDIAATLIAKEGIDLNLQNNEGKTPLHIAIENGHNALAEALIAKKGVDLNIKNNYGQTPLDIAIRNGHNDLAQALIEKAGINLNIPNNNTPLHVAVWYNNIDLVAALIEKEGINLNLQNQEGKTPLHIALERRYPETAKTLIEKEGINLNLQNQEGKTPLHIALERGYLEIAKALIAKGGVDLNLETKEGKTPLRIALETGRTDLIKLLIKTGANLNKTDKHGKLLKGFRTDKEKIRFFKTAIKDGDIELVKKLASNYKKLGTAFLSKLSGETLVSYAIKHKQPEITAYLIEAGFIPKKSWGEFFARIFKPKKAEELYALEKKLDQESLDLLDAMKKKKTPQQLTSIDRTSFSRSSINSRHSIYNSRH